MMKLPPAPRLRHYGLNAMQYVELWEYQQGKCPICLRRFVSGRPANIDHDHETFEVRGLLCGSDNQRIGWDHEDINWYIRAAQYLTTPTSNFIWMPDEVPRVAGAPPIRLTDMESD